MSEAGAGPTLDRATGEKTRPPLLEVRDLSVIYPNGARGVNGVDLVVPDGAIVGILGRNGAGKSSLLRGLVGFLRSEHVTVTGSVRFRGEEIAGGAPRATYRRGLLLVPEREKVFPSLTVEDNLRLCGGVHPEGEPIYEFDALDRRRTSRAALLSGGERQMLALAMAWDQNPELLLVDELSLGLAPVAIKTLMEHLRRRTDETGTSAILVEQDANAALKVCDYIYVLNHGEVTMTAEASAVSPADIQQKYLGGGL